MGRGGSKFRLHPKKFAREGQRDALALCLLLFCLGACGKQKCHSSSCALLGQLGMQMLLLRVQLPTFRPNETVTPISSAAGSPVVHVLSRFRASGGNGTSLISLPSPPSLPQHHRPYDVSPLLLRFPSLASVVMTVNRRSTIGHAFSSYPSSSPPPPPEVDTEKAKLEQVVKRLESTSRNFKRLGSLGFWGQLVSTVVAAVILSFSSIITGKITSPATFYATAGGIAAAFVSVFWYFGYIRLSERLRRTASDPAKAPPRAEVVKSLRNGIVVNLLGMGLAVLGMQATVGSLVAKALTTSTSPFYQGISPGSSPVLALDVFLVQASANTVLSHFLGLACSLELLRSVTLPLSESSPIPRPV